MAVTIREVARLANTSIATVSKVLNGSPSISDATIERVKNVMRELDYTPNRRAQNFAKQATHSIAFITRLERDSAFLNPHMFEIMSGVQTMLAKKGYSLSIVGIKRGECDPIEKIMAQKSADGIILHASVITKNVAQLVTKEEFPHVVIGTPNFESTLCWVDNNNLLSGQMAAKHLIEVGKRNIAYIGGTKEDAISFSRWQGVLNVLHEENIKLEERLLKRGSSTRQDGNRMMNELLSLNKHPDAVICANNNIAVGCMKALENHNISVPRDIAVITFDNYPFSCITDPMLTVVNIDVYDLGLQAGKLMVDKIKKPNLHVQSYSTLPSLIIRESTKL